jgi:transcriptional regulator GlxA family with amidase domain
MVELVRELRRLFVTDGILVKRLVDESCAAAAQSVVNRLENYFLSLLSREEPHPVAEQDKRADLYSAAVAVMYRYLSKRLSAGEIAAHCGMSVSTMQKLFLRYTGMGMMNYYASLRMRHAKQLLESGRTVKEVAYLLGFGDQNYFSTVYRRHFGMPPSAVKGDGAVTVSNREQG